MASDEYRKRRRESKQQYRKRVREVTLAFPKATAHALEELASKRQMSLPKFIKSCAITQLQGTGYVVANEQTLHRLIVQICKVGNLCNQIVRYVHASRTVHYRDIEELQQHISAIEEYVHQSLTIPPSIEGQIRQYLQDHPDHVSKLMNLLKEIEDDN